MRSAITCFDYSLNICACSFYTNSIASKTVFADISLSKIFRHISCINWKCLHFFISNTRIVSTNCNWVSVIHSHVCLSIDGLIVGCCLNLGLCMLTDFFRISLNDVLWSLEDIRKLFINNIKIFNKRTWTHRSVSVRILSLRKVLCCHLRIKHLHSIVVAKVVWLEEIILLLKIKVRQSHCIELV